MKEYPDPNYTIRIESLYGAISSEMGTWLPESYHVAVNRILSIAVIDSLPETPWPPPEPVDHDHWESAAEAAQLMFATCTITIAPTIQSEARVQAVTTGESSHTVFWLPRERFEAIKLDLDQLFGAPRAGESPRLFDLGDRPFARFLTQQVTHARLSDYDRMILCL